MLNGNEKLMVDVGRSIKFKWCQLLQSTAHFKIFYSYFDIQSISRRSNVIISKKVAI